MDYEKLRQIAKPYIKTNSVPVNAFLILADIGIPFKNERQCKKDFGNNMSPLFNTPAFLAVCNGVRTIYYNSEAKYLNFYILHEIAHYILNHKCDSPQNELDANFLACILAAPVENLPTTFKTANDLSVGANIPIDKAEEYWDIVKDKINRKYFSKKRKIMAGLIVVLIVSSSICMALFVKNNVDNLRNNTQTNTSQPKTYYLPTNDHSPPQDNNTVIVTSSGEKYHLKDCKHVKYKINITEYSLSDAINYGFKPCMDCIKK